MTRPASRRPAALLAACLALAILVLPGLAGRPPSAAATPGVSGPRAQARLQAEHRGSALTVPGPRMWDPRHSSQFTHRSWVTVSQTSNLVNQMVKVSWTGFTPSSQLIYDPDTTDYPVMVAECKGLHPTQFSQCFGANNGGVQGSFSAYGPMNTSYATTAGNGTGQLYIQILTGQQDQQLGCDLGHPCSLAVVPSQGGNIFVTPHRCSDHSQDTGQSDIGAVAFNSTTGTCSWRDRIIVPLHFARTPLDCAIKNASFTAVGSPMLARAMAQWQAALCSGPHPMSIQYDSALSEPLARQDFLNGTDDVALTTRPATGKGVHPYTYAPIAISAESIAYWVDDPVTGRPRTGLRLDQSLVLKLLTQSYDFDNEACGAGKSRSKGAGCDNGVDGDPLSLFADPEFRALNPHVASVGDGYQVPTVLSGDSDMTWELTRWIAANPAALHFDKGQFDRWGEHINTDYLNLALPSQSLTSMDPYPLIAHRYTPVFPLSQVAQYQADNWYPATNWQKDNTGNYPKLSPEIPGDRALFAIVDEADAAAYRFPVAALPNHAGAYVTPTAATMRAALADMRTSGNHITQDIKEDGTVKNAYPLTMVIYAMVPTGGISTAEAAKIAQFLDFAATSGQRPGNSTGQLPPGYLPLPSRMRAQTLAAASEVLHQTADKPKPKPGGTPSPTPSAAPTPSPASGATHPATPAPTGTPTPAAPRLASQQNQVRLGSVSDPESTGVGRLALPVLLAAGALLVAVGFCIFIGDRTGSALVARLRRLSRGRPLPGRTKP